MPTKSTDSDTASVTDRRSAVGRRWVAAAALGVALALLGAAIGTWLLARTPTSEPGFVRVPTLPAAEGPSADAHAPRLPPSPHAGGSTSRRVALVVGNSRYVPAEAALPNPQSDARLIAETLRSLGFEVTERTNLESREFHRVLREFAGFLKDERYETVFYYSGHGVQIDKRNYLVPVDVNLRDVGEVVDLSIDLAESVLSNVDRKGGRARIFIIDACRDDPFSGQARRPRVDRGLAESTTSGSALIAYSAGLGQAAEDGPPGGNSVFTRALASAMKVEGLDVELMLKNVRLQVVRETQQRQVPWVTSSLIERFLFNPASGGAGAPSAAATAGAGTTAGPAVADAALPRADGTGLRSLRLQLHADPVLNTDQRDASASLALRVYLLRDGEAIQQASFDSLYENDELTLGQALVRREALHLRPGESRQLELALGEGARYVAVVAAYRELEHARWRTLLPLPPEGATPTARLNAKARQVQLTWVP